MPDMLVKLFELPDIGPLKSELLARGIIVRRAVSTEKRLVRAWVRETFSDNWADECDVAFSNHPVSCFIATEHGTLIGFACHDVFAYKNYFGPTGVSETHRGAGIGQVLLVTCLEAMAAQGYAYGIISWVGPAEFYSKAVGATIIDGALPPVYHQLLSETETRTRGDNHDES